VTAVLDSGQPAPGYRGTVHLASSDARAQLPPDLVFEAGDAGVKRVRVALAAAGVGTLTATDLARPGAQGSASVTVQPGPARSYQLVALPTAAAAGEPLVLAITALDEFGNIATSYAGQAQVSSTDPTDVLPATGGFTAGVRTVTVAFTRAGDHTATVADPAGAVAPVETTPVAVSAGAPFRIAIAMTEPTAIAGIAEPLRARLLDLYDNPCLDYAGTLHFASTDPTAVIPADYTFVPGDAGVHDFSVTLTTAGPQVLAIGDTVSTAVTGSVTWRVDPAVATSCVASQAPATAVAGSVIGLAVVVHDAFDNVATSYAGTIRLTSTDARANLPPDVTYAPISDAGRHVFSAALLSSGDQTVTATDTANTNLHCQASIAISPAALRLVLTMPGDANAGYPVNLGVAVRDLFDNPIQGYTGTVTFTSSDTAVGSVAPTPITFTGVEGGTAITSATFMTIGPQTIAAQDGGTPVAAGSATSAVHGLVYRAPTSGRVRLVANPAQSNAQIAQFDLVANERLEVSSFFGGGPGSFAAGMNLPLDTTRVTGDAALFTPGNALPPANTVAIARIGESDHVLYAAVSRKRIAGTIFSQATEVAAGQVFYSVRLRLQPTATVGPIFDGAQPSPLFRAAVRDQYGDDFVNQDDFGLGALEVR
jgi:hypothetical protein